MKDKDIKSLLKKSGLKLTPQRIEITRFIFEHNHCSASEIKEYTDKNLPSVSFSTIYLTLMKLMETGNLIPITFEPGVIRYDTNTYPHYHIICTECFRIEEVPINIYEKFSDREFKSHNFSDIEGFEIHFFGVCDECMTKGIRK